MMSRYIRALGVNKQFSGGSSASTYHAQSSWSIRFIAPSPEVADYIIRSLFDLSVFDYDIS